MHSMCFFLILYPSIFLYKINGKSAVEFSNQNQMDFSWKIFRISQWGEREY